jgi:hypothetical protein
MSDKSNSNSRREFLKKSEGFRRPQAMEFRNLFLPGHLFPIQWNMQRSRGTMANLMKHWWTSQASDITASRCSSGLGRMECLAAFEALPLVP